MVGGMKNGSVPAVSQGLQRTRVLSSRQELWGLRDLSRSELGRGCADGSKCSSTCQPSGRWWRLMRSEGRRPRPMTKAGSSLDQ
jgi:hypothetical protein